MKRIFMIILVLVTCVSVSAQFSLPPVPQVSSMTPQSDVPKDSVFICTNQDPLLGNSAFAQCFAACDLNHDFIVTYGEASQATELFLSRGGRKNIIGNYDFLKHFPCLIRLDVGNTPLEELDLTHNPRLEELDLRSALRLKRIKLAKGCSPRIVYPNMEGDFTVTIVAPTE